VPVTGKGFTTSAGIGGVGIEQDQIFIAKQGGWPGPRTPRFSPATSKSLTRSSCRRRSSE
jgi:hypothetical protein